MWRSLLVASLLLVAPAVPARAQAVASPSAAQPTEPQALVLARSAADAVTTALDRTAANLAAILETPAPKSSKPMSLQVFSKGRPLPIKPLGVKGGIAVDAATRAELKATGRAVRYVARPQPHFLVAAETRTGRRRSLGVEIPVRDMAQALDGVRLPANTTLDLLSRDGDQLAHPQRPLPPEERAIAATLAGGMERSSRVGGTTLGYAPIAETGIGVLVRTAAPATATPVPSAVVSPAIIEPTAAPAPPEPATRPTVRVSRREGLLMAAGGLLVALLFGLIGWLRGRWRAQLAAAETKAETPSLSNVARLAAAVASGLPALRESLGSASRALDRAFLVGTGKSPQLSEAHDLAQDVSEQAEGLLERLEQAARLQPPPLRDVSAQLTQLALELALAAAQPGRQDEVVKAATRLKELAAVLPQLEGQSEAPSLPYLAELAAALKARCERLGGVLAAESEEGTSPQLQMAREALEKAVAQSNLLADRVRTLERHLPIPEDNV
ncbi:MAG TPA: hypothetical protein V6D05_17005 [Stenomitos sp.]